MIMVPVPLLPSMTLAPDWTRAHVSLTVAVPATVTAPMAPPGHCMLLCVIKM